MEKWDIIADQGRDDIVSMLIKELEDLEYLKEDITKILDKIEKKYIEILNECIDDRVELERKRGQGVLETYSDGIKSFCKDKVYELIRKNREEFVKYISQTYKNENLNISLLRIFMSINTKMV